MDRPFGIMFHHFHNEKHYKGQGSIDAEQLNSILCEFKNNLLDAGEWLDKAKKGTLGSNDICITFDDALLSQYEVALPVLKKHNLTAFWFVYTSIFEGKLEKLEIYRKFRHIYFENIDDFYDSFFRAVENSPYDQKVKKSLQNYSHSDYSHYPFYTPDDTRFRYIRDIALNQSEYDMIMSEMMKNLEVDENELAADLWMSREHVSDLHERGHIVGLHSHTHPTNMGQLPYETQKKEYETNFNILKKLMGEEPKTVAHPADSYNRESLSILKSLGIEIGFEATMKNKMESRLTFPREDHVNILKKMRKKL